ncbi:helix-turn-helix transcriptional regulator [Paenibacillus macerans]|uniref:helix-turn-helix transcriptional regulator n=1 Tax=Paenibacillus macerans TaxID=44252 RepID=UPI00203FAFDD|nr:helix-turn-helix transcriptional regulator [Paenibacillus macerans]MCM3703779.1 helix-turn-helix domain-containing protein [Paenibacillus macerans]
MKNEKMIELRGDRSLREIAEQIGIPYSTYAMIESGHRFPRKTLAIKLAQFFETTVDELFFTPNDRAS